jgi:hypothetical protein
VKSEHKSGIIECLVALVARSRGECHGTARAILRKNDAGSKNAEAHEMGHASECRACHVLRRVAPSIRLPVQDTTLHGGGPTKTTTTTGTAKCLPLTKHRGTHAVPYSVIAASVQSFGQKHIARAQQTPEPLEHGIWHIPSATTYDGRRLERTIAYRTLGAVSSRR